MMNSTLYTFASSAFRSAIWKYLVISLKLGIRAQQMVSDVIEI